MTGPKPKYPWRTMPVGALCVIPAPVHGEGYRRKGLLEMVRKYRKRGGLGRFRTHIAPGSVTITRLV